jgi:hypothetical protein
MRGFALWGPSMAMLSVERLISRQRSASSAVAVATATAAPSRLTNASHPKLGGRARGQHKRERMPQQAQNDRNCVIIGTQRKRADRGQDGQAWAHLAVAVPSHADAGENDCGQ